MNREISFDRSLQFTPSGTIATHSLEIETSLQEANRTDPTSPASNNLVMKRDSGDCRLLSQKKGRGYKNEQKREAVVLWTINRQIKSVSDVLIGYHLSYSSTTEGS